MPILQTLLRGTMHGCGSARHIQETSIDVLQIEEGSLYPALQRMLIKGWVTAQWQFERVTTAIARIIQI